jgi:hypothetical protein
VLTDVIVFRVQALVKHTDHVEAMHAQVDHAKRVSVGKYEEYHEHAIKNYDFQPGVPPVPNQ